MPAFAVPVIASPSTVTSNFKVSFIGVVVFNIHVRRSPSAAASRISTVSLSVLAVPPTAPSIR